MREIKEAIELLEKAISEYDGPMIKFYYAKVNVKYYVAQQNLYDKALALLRPLAEPCKTCGGVGKIVRQRNDCPGVDWEPCPDCQDEEPEASEFTKRIRKEYALIWQERECTFAKDILNMANFIDRQAAELDKANQEARNRLVRADTLAAEKAELEEKIEYAKTCIETGQGHSCPLCKDYLKEAEQALSN